MPTASSIEMPTNGPSEPAISPEGLVSLPGAKVGPTPGTAGKTRPPVLPGSAMRLGTAVAIGLGAGLGGADAGATCASTSAKSGMNTGDSYST
jgi:hypothetical protein